MNNKFYNLIFSSLIIFSLFVSCKKDEAIKQTKSLAVSSEKKYVYTEAGLESLVPLPNVEEIITNGIITYKIEYKTKYDNKDIIASGTITIPNKKGKYPLALIERGTIFYNSSAPSEKKKPAYEIFAGMGYVVFVPDLIGFGASKDILHPYFDYKYTATASIDMYRAVVDFIKNNKDLNVSLNDKFFITGYSQGGYSAMATYKYISENEDDIKVTAVGPGAGGYKIMSIVDNVLLHEEYPAPALLAMPLVNYNYLYAKKPLNDVFNEPYSKSIQEVIDGKKEWGEIALSLPKVINDLFNNDLVSRLKNGEKTFLSDIISANSVDNWKPEVQVRFYHYPLDEIIPIATTHATIDVMKKNGAKNVEYVEVPKTLVPQGTRSNHASAGQGAIFLAFMEFNKLK